MRNSTFSKFPHFLLALLVCCLSAGSSWAHIGSEAAAEADQAPTLTITRLDEPYGERLSDDLFEIGREALIRIEVSDANAGDEVTLSWMNVGSDNLRFQNATFSHPIPYTGQAPYTVEIRWTPTLEEASHYHVIKFTATDQMGLSTEEHIFPSVHMPARFLTPQEPVRIAVGEPFRIPVGFTDEGDWLEVYARSPTLELRYEPEVWQDAALAEEGTRIWYLNVAPYNDQAHAPTAAQVGEHQINLSVRDGYRSELGDPYTSFTVIVDPACSNKAWYRDADGDGYGAGEARAFSCTPPPGFVDNNLDCDDANAAIYPGAGGCEGAENQAPRITLSGDVGLDRYEVGREYFFYIQVSDPEGDEVTLDLDVYQWEPDVDGRKIPLSPADFMPDFPITQKAPFRVTLSFSPTEEMTRFNQMDLTATDAAGNKTTVNSSISIWQQPYFIAPDIITVTTGEDFFFNFFLQNWEEGMRLEASGSTLPLFVDDDQVPGILYITSRDAETPSDAHVGSHDVELIATRMTSAGTEVVVRQTITIHIVPNCSMQTWYPDRDGDGWGRDYFYARITSCSSIEGYSTTIGDCDDWDASIYPGVGDCPAVDNQAPVFALEGDPERMQIGQENRIRITATDPDGEALSLRLLAVYDHNYNEVDLFEGATLTPMLPLSGTGTVSTELRWTPTSDQLGLQEMHLLAEDATGNQTRLLIIFRVIDGPHIGGPDHITVPVGEYFQVFIPVEGAGGTLWTSARDGNLPLDVFEGTPGIQLFGQLSAEYLGTHEVTLVAGFDAQEFATRTLRITVVQDCQLQAWYPDDDGDGYGRDNQFYRIDSCTPPAGYVANREDCDDQDPNTYPGAPEIPGDGKDNNCDGQVDEESDCPAIKGLTVASACSQNPQNFRSWVIHNPNACAVEVRYDLRQSDIEGTLWAQPGETHFQTPFIEGNMNIMQLHWQDEAGKEQMYRYREPANTGLRIFTVCSDNPQEELRWRIHNPNECAYYVAWHIEGSNQQGSYIAPPGDSFITTATIPSDPNVAVLMYYNYHSKPRYSRQASAYRNCSGSQEPDCTISRELTIASSCSDDPFNYRNWVIYNPHSCAVKVRYDLRHTDQQASLMAAPGYTYIQTPFIEGSRNIIDLHWQDSDGKDQRYRFREPANTSIRIFSECSDNPERELRWRIHNPNPCPYYVQWSIRGSQQKGAFTAPPGDSYISTRPEPGANIAVLTYYNYQSKQRSVQKAATFKTCQGGAPTRTIIAEGAEETLSVDAGLSVYPVPFRDVMQVRHEGIKANVPVRVALISLNGTSLEVSAGQIRQADGSLELDLQQLPLANGLYLLRLDLGGEKPLYQRVIRQQ